MSILSRERERERERKRERKRERESERETFTCNRVHLSMHSQYPKMCTAGLPGCFWGPGRKHVSSSVQKGLPVWAPGPGEAFWEASFVLRLGFGGVRVAPAGGGRMGAQAPVVSSGPEARWCLVWPGSIFCMVHARPCETACPGWSSACGEVATSVCSLWRVHHKRGKPVASSPYQYRRPVH